MSYTSTYTAAPVAGLMPKLRMSLNAFRAYSADQRAKRQTFRELSAMNELTIAPENSVPRCDLKTGFCDQSYCQNYILCRH